MELVYKSCTISLQTKKKLTEIVCSTFWFGSWRQSWGLPNGTHWTAGWHGYQEEIFWKQFGRLLQTLCEKFPNLSHHAKTMASLFGSTYCWEQFFSKMKLTKTRWPVSYRWLPLLSKLILKIYVRTLNFKCPTKMQKSKRVLLVSDCKNIIVCSEKKQIFSVSRLNIWIWLYGPPIKNVAHPCFRVCDNFKMYWQVEGKMIKPF